MEYPTSDHRTVSNLKGEKSLESRVCGGDVYFPILSQIPNNRRC